MGHPVMYRIEHVCRIVDTPSLYPHHHVSYVSTIYIIVPTKSLKPRLMILHIVTGAPVPD